MAERQIRGDTLGHRRKREETARVHTEHRGPAARRQREERWVGTAGVANYFRKPYGPGWALVGDAGYDKDPITAQGISDAFIDAETSDGGSRCRLSGAAAARRALAEYQSSRDQRAKPLYDFTCELATLAPAPPPMQELFAALHGNREATNQFYSALNGIWRVPEREGERGKSRGRVKPVVDRRGSNEGDGRG